MRRGGRPGALALLLAACLFLSGCWHQVPLEQRGLVALLGIDAAAAGGYTVTTGIIFPPGLPAPGPGGAGGGGGGGSAHPLFLRSASAPTVSQALHALAPSSYLLLDFTHLQVVIVSEQVARAGLVPAFSYLARSPEFTDTAFLLVAARGTAAAVLQAISTALPQPNEVLTYTLRWNRLNTPFSAVRFFEALSEMPLRGRSLATAGVAVGPSSSGETVPTVLSGEALFRGQRLVGWLQGGAALGYAVVSKRLHHQGLEVSTAEGPVALDLTGASRRVRVRPQGSAAPQVELSVLVRAHLVSATQAELWDAPANLRAIEQAAAAVLAPDVQAALDQTRAQGTDPLGLGEYVRLADPAYWDRVGQDWATAGYPGLPVTVRLRVRISAIGEMLCPLLGC